SSGFVPWFDHRFGRNGLDPNFSHFSHLHANDPKWEAGLRELFKARSAGQVPRPPHTVAQQNQMLTALATGKTAQTPVHANINLTRTENVTALAQLKDVNNTKVTGLAALGQAQQPAAAQPVIKLGAASKADQDRTTQAVARFRSVGDVRKQAEDRMLQQ